MITSILETLYEFYKIMPNFWMRVTQKNTKIFLKYVDFRTQIACHTKSKYSLRCTNEMKLAYLWCIFCKVNIFWEDHKNLKKSPNLIWRYLCADHVILTGNRMTNFECLFWFFFQPTLNSDLKEVKVTQNYLIWV